MSSEAENTRVVHHLTGCAQGNHRDLEQLYRLTSPKLFGLLLRMLKSQAIAEDCLQQVYIKIWNHAGSFDPRKARAMTWLSTIARNQALDQLRKQQREALEPDDSALDTISDDTPGHDDELARQQHEKQVHQCVGDLPDNYRQCIKLAYFDGLTHALLAEKLQVPLGTVKTWVRRGLMRLKTCMTKSI
ncbi:sigma-70 family RNA polymerase sigma factor [Endozoicomonadaceae bacterium StTr2]